MTATYVTCWLQLRTSAQNAQRPPSTSKTTLAAATPSTGWRSNAMWAAPLLCTHFRSVPVVQQLRVRRS